MSCNSAGAGQLEAIRTCLMCIAETPGAAAGDQGCQGLLQDPRNQGLPSRRCSWQAQALQGSCWAPTEPAARDSWGQVSAELKCPSC